MVERTIFYAFALCSFALCQAQITFEPAYFINNAGIKTDCLIRNVDWKNNPTSFNYKLKPDGETQTAFIANVKEFQVVNEAKYIRAKVKINRATDDNNALDTDKKIMYSEEEIFLKTLSEGEAVLYYYEEKNLRRFFFKIDNSGIDQLVYKRYRTSEKINSYGDVRPVERIGIVSTYKQQLWNALKCKEVTRANINSLKYIIQDLVALFDRYNGCVDSNFIQSNLNDTYLLYKLKLRPGIQSSALSISNANSVFRNVEFGSKIRMRFGVEFEAVLPYNRNKWSLFFEPTFQSYKENTETRPFSEFSNTSLAVEAKYSSIEIPFGLRYYMYFDTRSKVFLNVAYVIDIPFDSAVTFGNPDSTELKFGPGGNFAIGFGFNYNKISIEGRYQASREVLNNDSFASYQSDYSGFSLIFGFNIL